MKKQLLTSFLLCCAILMYSQTVAYDATYTGYNNVDCLDLSYLDAEVRGHQINVTVDYFLTQVAAQNNVNRLPIYYEFISDNETLYSRVTNNNDSTFATSIVTIALTPFTCCPPPPNGIISYFICDVDNDGTEIAYLENLRNQSGNLYANNLFCGLYNNQINTTFHLTQQEAIDGTNAISEIYNFSSDIDIFYKITNTVNTEEVIHTFGIRLVTCTPENTDNDGIDDAEEDVNRNGDFYDDDTDKDGIKNYQDADDDGDGILTINEDHNNNGDPTDDDIDSNGIPDYLEFNVTLSNTSLDYIAIQLYPNPVTDYISIQLLNPSALKGITIIDLTGKEVLNLLETNTINVSNLTSGLYFIRLQFINGEVIKRFIKEN